MGIHDPGPLLQGPYLGPLFETAVFLEHLKWGANHGDLPPLTFFRTKEGAEVDILIEEGGKLHAREIKASRTLDPQMARGLLMVETLLKRSLEKSVLAPVEKTTPLSKEVVVQPWYDVGWSSEGKS